MINMKKNKKKVVAGLVLATMVLAGKYLHDQAFVGVEKKIVLKNEKIKDDIKITHITDFHSNVLSNLDEVLGNIRNFDPDLIFLTGDMIDYPTDKKIERTMYFLEKLNDLGIKTYFVSGNHEEVSADSEVFYKKIKKLGITKLDNNGEFVEIGHNRLYIYGLTYRGMNFDNFKPDNSLNIILSHFSKNVRDKYREDIDFIFSGHTHGGQVRAPFLGALIAPGEGYFPEYDRGLFEFNDSQIYIESGLGNTFLPLRFLNQVTYSNITIKRP